eukprot:15474469-Alexandrium_andersonii.AAC.1
MLRPQAMHHIRVHGAPPTFVRSLRAAALHCSPLAGRSRCTTTCLALSLGDDGDPAVVAYSAIVR